MFQWIKTTALAGTAWIQRREIEDWIRDLNSMNTIEVAHILAVAMHYRNSAMARDGVDLMRPFDAVARRPLLAMQLNHDLQLLKKRQMPTLASGATVWLFTVRAAKNPGLREQGRELWAQLARGFDCVDDAADTVATAIGSVPLLTGAGNFPDGFSPAPL